MAIFPGCRAICRNLHGWTTCKKTCFDPSNKKQTIGNLRSPYFFRFFQIFFISFREGNPPPPKKKIKITSLESILNARGLQKDIQASINMNPQSSTGRWKVLVFFLGEFQLQALPWADYCSLQIMYLAPWIETTFKRSHILFGCTLPETNVSPLEIDGLDNLISYFFRGFGCSFQVNSPLEAFVGYVPHISNCFCLYLLYPFVAKDRMSIWEGRTGASTSLMKYGSISKDFWLMPFGSSNTRLVKQRVVFILKGNVCQ